MTWQYTPYIIPVLVAWLIALVIAFLAWQRRDEPGATPLFFMMLCITEWLFFYMLEIGSTTLAGNLLWANLEYLGIVVAPVTWALFALEYTDSSKKITWQLTLLLLIEPIFILLAILTDGLHLLFRQEVILDSSGPFVKLAIERGPLFWIHVAYSYGLLAYGTYRLIKAYLHSDKLYRAQIGVSVIGAFIPWIVNILYISPLADTFVVDPTPIGFMVTGLMFAWGIFGFRLMDISPVARNWVVEQMDDGMFVIDKHDRVVDLNPAARLLLNKTSDQIIGYPIDEVFEEWSHLVTKYRKVERANEEIQFNNNGHLRTFIMNISPLYTQQKQLNGRLIILHDNTQQRTVENELRAAKETAEAASRAKSTFLANMSHELRTPLTAIIGYSELLQEQALSLGDKTLPTRLEKINISADHLLQIINDLLDLSKVEAGQMKLDLHSFPITSVIESVQIVVQQTIEKNKNNLKITIGENVDLMYADQAKVRQILLNILHNAAKFTNNGNISLAVERHPEDASLLRFTIVDSGIGIAQEHVEQLFRPFFQADYSTSRRYGGTGLGLAISYHLCKLMQGDISVQSSPNSGSCFTITLPVSVQETQSDYKPIYPATALPLQETEA